MIVCTNCQHTLTYAGVVPRFCSQCGAPLSSSVSSSAESFSTDFGNSERRQVDDSESTQLYVANTSASDLERTTFFDSDRFRDKTDAGPFPTGTAGVASQTFALDPGSHVGPYQIVRLLGAGGMGTVFEAEHSQTGQRVALKLVSKAVRSTPDLVHRFKRESMIAASINHPRSTFVYQSGQHLGQLYITMELMSGGTLTDVVQADGPLPIGRAVDYVIDMLSGLSAAHQAGIVHRDLKPANCFIDHDGRVKIGDFGLAKSFWCDSSLTQTGQFMGTPQYAAPEQLRSIDVDERADIYAVGGVLFYLLAGRAPFVGNAAQVIASITSDPPPKLETLVGNIPRELSRIVQQTLEKDPARRPENVEELRLALLPYSTRGTVTPDIGRRMAAFFIDSGTVFVIMFFTMQLVGVFLQLFSTNDTRHVTLYSMVFSFLLSVAYFSLLESRFGTTIGKWLMGMRVIAAGNHAPSLPAAILRATIIPGLSHVLNSLPVYWMGFNPVEMTLTLNTMFWMQLYQLLAWLPCLLCFVTARKETGFRGWHETLSGTRTVRLAGALEYRRPNLVPVTLPTVLNPQLTFGEFVGVGRLGQRVREKSSVLLGRDVALGRDVWIVNHTQPKAHDWWELRKEVKRLTRLRILAEQHDDQQHWVVTEAVKGLPLVDYIRSTTKIDWRSFRPLLREVAFELHAGLEDGTLPRNLGLRSVWVDSVGRAKLLDEPIIPAIAHANHDAATATEANHQAAKTSVTALATTDTAEPTATNWLDPFQLLIELLNQFIEHQIVPEHVLDLRDELLLLKLQPDGMARAEQRIVELADKPSAWRWDDRLGVLATSIGLEFGTGGAIAIMVATLSSYYFTLGPVVSGCLIFGVGCLISFLIGAILLGGPAFRVSGVLVRRNRTLEPASRFRCGARMMLAWLPLVVLATCVGLIADIVAIHGDANLAMNTTAGTTILLLLLICSTVLILWPIAAAYSIWQPARGLVDLVTRTRLIRK